MHKRILVLDDSPFMLTVIGNMLKKLNYEVTTVDNGEEACSKIADSRYDMIIADMNMPEMDGLEFTRRAKTHPNCRFVPIVMVSSEENQDKIAAAKKLGVSTFLTKPLSEKQLNSILQITLNKRRAPRIPVRLDVYYGEELHPTERIASHTFNLSIGGLFLETDEPLKAGSQIKLELRLTEKETTLNLQGRVAWVNDPLSPCISSHPPGMGVEFLDFSEESRIKGFLQSLSLKR